MQLCLPRRELRPREIYLFYGFSLRGEIYIYNIYKWFLHQFEITNIVITLSFLHFNETCVKVKKICERIAIVAPSKILMEILIVNMSGSVYIATCMARKGYSRFN